MINKFKEKAKKIPLSKIPNNIGQSILENCNYGFVCSSSESIYWELIVFKHEVLNKPFWSVDLEFESKFEQDFLIDLFLGLIEKTSPKLAYCFDKSMNCFDCHYYSNRFGIWAGLRDIYWLNYYGKEFVDLIGSTYLSGINSAKKGFKFNDGFFLQIQEKSLYNRDLVKKEIGEEFFIKKRVNDDNDPHEMIGFFALIRFLWKLRKEDKQRDKELAPSRPKIES